MSDDTLLPNRAGDAEREQNILLARIAKLEAQLQQAQDAVTNVLKGIRGRMVKGGVSWITTLYDFDQVLYEMEIGRECRPGEWAQVHAQRERERRRNG